MYFNAALIGAAALFTAAFAAPTPSNHEASTSYGSSYGSSYESSSGHESSYGSSYGGSYDKPEESQHKPPAEHKPEPQTVAHTTSAERSYETPSHEKPSYGSGKSEWGSDYDDCVSQCVAKYGSKPSAHPYTPPAPTAGSTGSSGGNGVVHTVIVAPQQGVLRFVPFAVNASVGDTVKFMWGANNHTVTQGSALLPCNKSGETASFTSGLKQKDFVFEQVVNTTDPTYFFCNAPTHCQKGMFGIINPAVNLGAPTSAGFMMSELTSKDADLKAYASLVQTETAGKAGANWGTNLDLGALPGWAHGLAAENIMYTRSLIANNQDIVGENGSIDLSSISTNPLKVPDDVPAALAAAAAAAPATPTAAVPPAVSSTPAETTGVSGGLNNGAGALVSSKAAMAAIAVVATFLML